MISSAGSAFTAWVTSLRHGRGVQHAGPILRLVFSRAPPTLDSWYRESCAHRFHVGILLPRRKLALTTWSSSATAHLTGFIHSGVVGAEDCHTAMQRSLLRFLLVGAQGGMEEKIPVCDLYTERKNQGSHGGRLVAIKLEFVVTTKMAMGRVAWDTMLRRAQRVDLETAPSAR
ncbi:hypothetical protein F5Y14DRAFT_450792 [Nemania sp. NC0429]|nr:hypothetical protein F5Y14DRAFT_450792 [Nemania sp. NC0429]